MINRFIDWLLRQKKSTAILDALMEGVITVDAKGVIQSINPVAAKMTGAKQGSQLHFLEAHPKKELLERCAQVLQLACKEGRIVKETIALEKTYLDLIGIPFKKGASLILQDKSSQHQVVEMGKDFIANASHEIRTPITIIKGFAETLQDLPSVSPKMLFEITEKIVRNCARIEALVQSLLTLSDIENVPESEFQLCDIGMLVDNCCYLLQTASPHIRVDIEKSTDPIEGVVDASLLELGLMNLLENGAKYSQAPVHLTIHLKESEKSVTIAVQDRGIGIPPEDLPHIFERFYTVDKARSRQLGGAGLGLSIVKTIVEKHAGTIAASSLLGQGTTFTLVLPKRRNEV